ncbi:hypothetical protein [Brachyspira sp.]|uniref:hypothetical protein n=1 Tax=Brachyspira sp. TaxID=1977261 RepID=UPI0026314FC4|nr:hypothetical protein [Brachyspira sp.]
MKKKFKKLLNFMPLILIIILVLWYKSPINGIKYDPKNVNKINITHNGNSIVITNTNDIYFIIKSLNSISLNKSIPKMKQSKYGYDINIHYSSASMFNNLTIYSSETASIGNFYYTDKNNILPYEYIKNIFYNKK